MTVLLLVAAAVIGIASIVAAVVRPRVVLIGLVTLDISGLNGVIDTDTGFSPYRAELAISVLAILVLAWRRQLRLAWSVVHLAVLVLLACCCLTLLTTVDPTTTMDVLADRARGVATWAIVFLLALSTRSLGELVKGVVGVMALLAGITVFHEYVLHNAGDLWGLSSVPLVQEGGALTPRHAGTETDVNFWARLLILIVPFALSLTTMARGTLRRLVWGASVLALLLGVYLTQSRGGFLAVLVAVVLWALLAGGWYRRSLLALPVVLLLLAPILGSRLATLGGATESTVFADESVVTRARFQLEAWHMFLDAPVLGHGVGSFPALFATYDRASNFYKPVTIVPAAHNFFLEQLADGGVVLMLAWLFLLGSMIFVAARAMVVMGPDPRNGERMIAVGVIASVVGWMAASVFLHLSDFRALLAVAAIAALLDVRYRNRMPAAVVERGDVVARRSPLIALAVIAVVGVVGAGAVWIATPPRYEVTSVLGVVRTSDSADWSAAYALDVVSRGPLPATFADVVDRSLTAEGLAARSGFPLASISAAQSRLGGAVQVVTIADDPADAEALAERGSVRATAVIDALRTGYTLRGSTSAPQLVRPLELETLGGGAVALVVLAAALLGLLRRSRPKALRRRGVAASAGAGV